LSEVSSGKCTLQYIHYFQTDLHLYEVGLFTATRQIKPLSEGKNGFDACITRWM